MQYLSLDPICLSLGDKAQRPGFEAPPSDIIDVQEKRERRRKTLLVEKLCLHTVINHPLTQKDLSLSIIISQINCSFEVDALLQKNIGLVRLRQKRTLSVSERVVESATDLWDYIQMGLRYAFTNWIYPVATSLFIFGIIAHRIAGEGIVVVAEWRPRPNSAALRDISATAQQVDLRLQQFFYSPIQYLTLRERKDDWESITNSHPEYIRFYNSLWLVANDVIIGVAIGAYIIENADMVAGEVDKIIGSWSLEGLVRIISWLMVNPAGLKLNNELAAFLGDLFLWIIAYWAGESNYTLGHEPDD